MIKKQIAEFFNNKAAAWDSICVHDQEKIKAVLSLCDLKHGMQMLDVACGTGVLEQYLLKYNPEKILAVDLAQNMIDIAKSKYRSTNIEFTCCDIFDVQQSGFDICFLYSAYPHFEDKAGLISHIASLLKKGGRFVVFHSQGRDTINALHDGKASDISLPLESAESTASLLTKLFSVDITVDTQGLYIVSGIKI